MDHTHTVIDKVLDKYSKKGPSSNYCLLQVLSDGGRCKGENSSKMFRLRDFYEVLMCSLRFFLSRENNKDVVFETQKPNVELMFNYI